MAVAARAHRSTWQLVDRFLAVSDFVAYDLTRAGFPPEKIVLHPKSAPSHGPTKPPGSGFVFIGRLTAEKGVTVLMEAWKASSARETNELVIAGDGPERDVVIAASGSNVRYEGFVDSVRVHQLLDEAAIVVIPSLCYEGFPRLVAEAFERGRPVASTALGALRNLITPEVGWTSEINADAIATMLSMAAVDPSRDAKAAAARVVFETRLTLELSLHRLIGIYADVTARATGSLPSHRAPGVG